MSSMAKHFREWLLELGSSHKPQLGDRRDRSVEKKDRRVGFFRPEAYCLREFAKWIHGPGPSQHIDMEGSLAQEVTTGRMQVLPLVCCINAQFSS